MNYKSKFGIMIVSIGVTHSHLSTAASTFGVYGARFTKEGVYLQVPTCKNFDVTLQDLSCDGTSVSGIVSLGGLRPRREHPDWIFVGCDWNHEIHPTGEAGCEQDDEYIAWGKELFVKYTNLNDSSAPVDAPVTVQELVDKGYQISYTGIRRDVVTKDQKVSAADLKRGSR